MTLSIFFLFHADPVTAQNGLALPSIKTPLTPLLDPSKETVSPKGIFPAGPVEYPNFFKYTTSLDSSGKTVVISEKAFSWDVTIPRRLSLNEYLTQRSEIQTNRLWKESVSRQIVTREQQTQGGRGITIQTPKIKSKAFKRITGGETLSLNVTGDITIDGSMRNEKRSQKNLALDRAPNTNFQMKQTQRFQVTGKIGNNISIGVDQDSERDFDFENAVKLDYTGDEDGIVQKIEAGNVALTLPATRFVTYSVQNSGLFGIKSQFKIGGLDITAIASMEKAQKKKISLTGGKEEQSLQVHDYEYKRFTYFFFDDYYRNMFTQIDPQTRLHRYEIQRSINTLEVYKSDALYENREGAFRALSLSDLNNPDTTITQVQQCYKGFFIRLEPMTDYVVNKELGYIIMNNPLQESEVLAVAYRDSSQNLYGQLIGTGAGTVKNPIFKMIKPRTPRPTDKTWNLEWKNVYSLGGRNLSKEQFDFNSFRIYYRTSSGDPKQSWETDGKRKGFLEIFGLDKMDGSGNLRSDDIIDNNPDIISWSRGELIFPDLTPFDPDNKFYPLPDELHTPAIYDTTDQAYIRKESKFYMEFKSSSRSANYSLGPYVVEGSEEVLLNGTLLIRGKDYILETFSGNLTILRQDALTPTSNLEVRYESQTLFSVDKKSLLGMRAEYTLNQNASTKSFIGATLLYFNQKTMDQRIRVGSQGGPYRNLVWDINSALYFQPNFITRALDALPIVEATAPSTVTFEGEIAQVIPNPNTLNNTSTGDKDGVAYLDDFEGSKRQIPLSIMRNGWVMSSPPTTSNYAKTFLSKRGRFTWYNPFLQTAIQEIWPNREVTTNYGGTNATDVLKIKLNPNTNLPHDSVKTSWGGIMMDLSSGYADQTESRFLEIWVKGNSGQLHLDLGQISEDNIPDGTLNTEDKYRNGIRNGQLDDDEDTGIDGMYGADPPTLFYPHTEASVNWNDSRPAGVPYDFWDINRNGKKEPNEPWSYDDYVYSTTDYSKINGTENSKNDGIVRYPDTEDINGNGSLDTNNDYYEFSFSLEKDSPDTVYKAGDGGISREDGRTWHLYRLPLNKPAKIIGQPNWSRIEYIRIWMDALKITDSCSIAEISLTGNEWKFQGTAMNNASNYTITNDSTMSIAVVNTHENPQYTPPPGVSGIIDPIQKIQSREQSLELNLYNLKPNETAIAQKQFYQSENIVNYRNLKMFVHGGNYARVLTSIDSVELFLRWGSDPQNKDYYEVRMTVFPGWDERNGILVSFEDLSKLKVQMESKNALSDSLKLQNGHIVSVVGKPSLTNIRWLILGVTNKDNKSPFSGGFWVDELRVSNVQKDKGMAMRARADLRFSDVIALNGEFTRQDADFHTVNERFGGGSNSIGGAANASIALHKFLPSSWGLVIPISLNYSKSLSTPKYLPNSDILINKRTMPDSLLKKIRSDAQQQGISVSFSKSKSRNIFMRYLLDPFRSSMSYSRSDMSNSQILFSRNLNITGSLNYSLSLSGQNYIQPFKWLGNGWLLKKMSQIRFYYLPSILNIDFSGNQSNRSQETREGVLSKDTTANFTRRVNTAFKPFSTLSMDYSRSYSSDMRRAEWSGVLADLSPGDATSEDQSFSTNFDPKIFSFFSPSFRFNSNYRWNNNVQMKAQGTNESASVGSSITIGGSFDPSRLVDSFSNKTTSAKPRTIRAPDKENLIPKQEEQKKDNNDKTNKKNEFVLIALLKKTGSLIKKIDPISINLTQRDDRNDNGIVNGKPNFLYQFGFPGSSNLGFDYSQYVGSNKISKRNDLSLSLRTGIRITTQLRLSIDYSLSNSENLSNQRTGTITKSVYSLNENIIPFPSWSLSWGGLEKLPIVSKYVRTISFSHNFSGRQTISWNDYRSKITQDQISKDFRPFAQFNISFKNGMTCNVQYQKTESFSKRMSYGSGKTKSISNGLSVTANYSKTGGLRLPFFKNKSLQNTIDFSLSFESSRNAQYQSMQNDTKFNEDNIVSDTQNWSFRPRLTYRFTNTVSGGTYLELGKRSDKRIGSTSVTAFGINAAISLAGQ